MATTALLLLVFGIGLLGAVRATGWQAAVEALKFVGPLGIVALLMFSLTHYAFRAARWHLLTRAADLPTTGAQNVRHYFGGLAMTATPGRLGELVRLRWIHRETGWAIDRVASIALGDRAIEVAGMAIVIALSVGLSRLGAPAVWLLVAVALVLAGIVSRPDYLISWIERLWRLTGRAPRFFVRLRRVATGLAPFTRLPVLLPTLGFSMLGWFAEGVAFFFLLKMLGAPIGLWAAAAIFLAGVLSGALSGLPGGLGGTEVAIVGLLILVDVPAPVAILATGIIRLTTLWFAVLIGVCVFPFAEGSAARSLRASESRNV